MTYLAFAAALFLRSAHLCFINWDSFLRPAALSLSPRFPLVAFLVGVLLVLRLACVPELEPIRRLRAEISFAISASISRTIRAVSTESSPLLS